MDVFFEAIENGRQTHVTGPNNSISRFIEINEDIIDKIKDKIIGFSNCFSESLTADETSIEFSFGVSSEGNLFILSGNSSLGIKVKLKWKKQ